MPKIQWKIKRVTGIKGSINWWFSIKSLNGRELTTYHCADACTYPEGQKRVRKFVSNLSHREIIVEVL